jgi:hypothetical protein
MGKYDDIEFQRLLQTPIADILAHFGKDRRPRRKNMYLSPFRQRPSASSKEKASGSTSVPEKALHTTMIQKNHVSRISKM